MAVRKKLSEVVISSVIQDKIRDDLSGKLETVREFYKTSWKIKILGFQDVYTYVTPTQFWNTTNLAINNANCNSNSDLHCYIKLISQQNIQRFPNQDKNAKNVKILKTMENYEILFGNQRSYGILG